MSQHNLVKTETIMEFTVPGFSFILKKSNGALIAEVESRGRSLVVNTELSRKGFFMIYLKLQEIIPSSLDSQVEPSFYKEFLEKRALFV